MQKNSSKHAGVESEIQDTGQQLKQKENKNKKKREIEHTWHKSNQPLTN